MSIDQIIEAYTYARVSGSAKPLDHLDLQAERYVKTASPHIKNRIDFLFAKSEYEAKLRCIRNENTNRES